MHTGAVVSWISRTQHCVTLSSTEAEYIAMANDMKEIMFSNRIFLALLGLEARRKNVEVFEDNEGVTQIAKDPLSSA